jgi:translocation and assembly module TamA
LPHHRQSPAASRLSPAFGPAFALPPGTMRIRPFASALGVIAALLGTTRAIAAQRAEKNDQSERPEVRSLTLSGVRSVDRDELLQSIATSASHCKSFLLYAFCPLSHSSSIWDKRYLDRTELRRDVLRIRVFYWIRGFRQATVDTAVAQRSNDEVAVTFKIVEGAPTLVRDVRVRQLDSVLTTAQLNRVVELKKGEPLNLIKLDSTVSHLRAVLQDRGYADARVDTATAVDTAAHQGDATITVNPRWLVHVGPIGIEGNKEVSEPTIRNSLSFKTGDLFRRNEIATSQRRLYESSLFQRASITTLRVRDTTRAARDSAAARLDRVRSLRDTASVQSGDSASRQRVASTRADTIRAIEINVAEAPPRISRVSGGFNTFDFVQVDARFTHNNFFGGARRLEAVATLGNLFAKQLNGSTLGGLIRFENVTEDVVGDADEFLNPTYNASLDFTQPWLWSPRNSGGVGIFAYRRLAPGVFVERGEGANISFTRDVADRVPVSIAYRFELTSVAASDVYFCVNYGVCDIQTIAALKERQRISPIVVTANLNRANDPLEPRRGYTSQVRLEHASAYTGSSFRYNSVYLDAAAYRPVGNRSVLAAHSRVGWVRALSSTTLATSTGIDVSGDILHPRTRLYAGGARSVRGVGENQLGPRVLTVPPSKLAVICPELTGLAVVDCDLSRANAAGNTLQDRDFVPRPLGGRALLEGSVEFRFPVWGNLFGATFLDGAVLGQGSIQTAAKGAGALTPGVGIRYISPVGPIRVDVGLNPSRADALPVVTQVMGPDGQLRIVQLKDDWKYNPTKGASGITGMVRRLTLHLSIGEAY